MDISQSAISSFQSPERLELLNDIDRFRQHGLHNLPQIVVCGDTSSGKSSVLGALSGIKFPVSGTICTRFATEIALRYSAAETITGHAFITAAATASESHKSKVESFRRDIASLDGIPALMDDARKQMGLAESSGISRDVLHLRLAGRELANLTLVDLPGLIHASRNTDDIFKVKGLVEDYFRQEESIILIVVSAENVIDNQGILTSSREFDPKGVRSIGVITKPDVLERPDKCSLKPAIMELARNQNTSYQFTRGWHVVRCLNDKERTDGLDREDIENQLFSQEQWKSVLQHKQLGIKSLRSNLSKYLHQHILQVLPELQKSLETEVKETKSSLELLGDARKTSEECMGYLIRISGHYGKIVRDALEGNYSDAFFQDGDPVKRLRAKTMALTEEYEEVMRSQGHSFSISHDGSQVGESTANTPEAITHSDALLKVGKLLDEHRGPELSFLFNPRLVGVLFKEQSSRWLNLTKSYTSQIGDAVQDFLRKLLDFLCPSQGETSYLIYHHILQDAVQRSLDSLGSKTIELFNPYETPFLFSTRRRLQTSLKRIEDEAHQQESGDTGTQPRKTSGPEIMGSDYDTRVKLLQYSEAYYDVAIENFIDNVVILGVEACLLSKLEAMFTSETVMDMDEQARNLAGGESADTQGEREALNSRLATLVKALGRCRTHTSRHNWRPARDDAQSSPPTLALNSTRKVDGHHNMTNIPVKKEEIYVPQSDSSPQKQIKDTSSTPTFSVASPITKNTPLPAFTSSTPPSTSAFNLLPTQSGTTSALPTQRSTLTTRASLTPEKVVPLRSASSSPRPPGPAPAATTGAAPSAPGTAFSPFSFAAPSATSGAARSTPVAASSTSLFGATPSTSGAAPSAPVAAFGTPLFGTSPSSTEKQGFGHNVRSGFAFSSSTSSAARKKGTDVN